MRRIGYRHPSAVVGEPAEVRIETPHWDVMVEPSATLEAGVTVDNGTFRRTWIGPDVWLMKKVHIAHDCILYEGVEVAPHANILGECEIGPHAKIGGSAVVLPGRKIGQRARVGAGAVVTHDVPPGETWVGNPARRLVTSQDKAVAHATASTHERAANTAWYGPETSSPATAADDDAAARSASQVASSNPGTKDHTRASPAASSIPSVLPVRRIVPSQSTTGRRWRALFK